MTDVRPSMEGFYVAMMLVAIIALIMNFVGLIEQTEQIKQLRAEQANLSDRCFNYEIAMQSPFVAECLARCISYDD